MPSPTRHVAIPVLLLAFVACDSSPTDQDALDPEPDGSGMVAEAPGAGTGASGFLVNTDMETDEGWWFWGPQGTSRSYSSERVHSGSRSIRLAHPTTTGPGEFSYAGQFTPVENEVEKSYTLTVRMRLENVQGQGVALAVRGDTEGAPKGYAEAFATTQGKTALVGTTDWMEVSVVLDRVDPDINSIAVYLLLLSESSGAAFFDDVEFSVSDWTPASALQNGGFEVGTVFPYHWWRGGKGFSNFFFEWHGVEAWQGARAVSMARHGESDEEFAFWAQTIFAKDFRGGPATLRIWIKTDLVGDGVSIVIRGDDTFSPSGDAEAAVSTQGRIPITGTWDWTEYSVTLAGVPSTLNSLTVYMVYLPNTTGTVLFDDARLTP